MHNNYYFLRHLSGQLSEILSNLSLIQCFSQNKDELILIFENETQKDKNFIIKANLGSQFSCLVFPEVFKRANSNSVDLFPDLIGKKVLFVRQHQNERAFTLEFNANYHLVFKLFGNKSNIILLKNNEVASVFKANLKADQNLKLQQLERVLELNYTQFANNDFNLEKTIPTLGKQAAEYIYEQYKINCQAEKVDQKHFWQFIMQQIELFNASKFYLFVKNQLPVLSLFNENEYSESFEKPIQAINKFYLNYSKIDGIAKEKNDINIQIENQINKLSRSLSETQKRLTIFEQGPSNEQIANIIMANIHLIPEYAVAVELFNFYDNSNIKLKLKKDLTPQKNAESYYRKSKNEKLEVEAIQQKIIDLSSKIDHLKAIKIEIEAHSDIKLLRKFLVEKQLVKAKVEANPELPFKTFEVDGWQIWIGRNAANNDLLTLKYAKKDDLWLHARDVSGSHVIIRYQAGKTFPRYVIERAAELAAFYSKRATDTVCSVMVTPKKYVRKPKKLPAGKVIVDKEETILVSPKGP
jgi:predicted ribosome quality control (RQC) complex YloA/Tae2 family protein